MCRPNSCSSFRALARFGTRMDAQKQTVRTDGFAKSMCHAALISTLVLSPLAAVATTGISTPEASREASSSVVATVNDDKASCPNFTGLQKYVCYGPCCGVPWGPGGPIFLALSAVAFRTAMPYRFSSWLRSSEEDSEIGPVDKPVLAFSAALFLSSVPYTFGGVAVGWLLLVVCLV